MLIDLNKVDFDVNPSFGDYIEVYLDKSYIESVMLEDKSFGVLYYTYIAIEKLLYMRNCDSIYIANWYKEFKELEIDLLNNKLTHLRQY